jgi:hypothetical protein
LSEYCHRSKGSLARRLRHHRRPRGSDVETL